MLLRIFLPRAFSSNHPSSRLQNINLETSKASFYTQSRLVDFLRPNKYEYVRVGTKYEYTYYFNFSHSFEKKFKKWKKCDNLNLPSIKNHRRKVYYIYEYVHTYVFRNSNFKLLN